ncbi:MAG: hypothetical protein LBN12_05805 [Clostridiales Family XIII bacterium]|jgi:hypothetical protein|nr:hypothetical protein [Clostridiales Family XIII bacterium]
MRDFFYNKSDVLIAIIIILIAAFVIYTRVGVIMDYPSKAAGGEGTGYLPGIQEVLAEGSGDAGEEDAGGEDASDGEDSADISEPEPATPPSDPSDEEAPAEEAPAEEAPAETVTPPAPPEATSPAEVTITVSAGDVGSTIADKLIAAGAITDKAAFLAEVAAQQAETKLKQGTFKIPAGSTLAEIVKIIVG